MGNGFESELRLGTISRWLAGVVQARAIWEIRVKGSSLMPSCSKHLKSKVIAGVATLHVAAILVSCSGIRLGAFGGHVDVPFDRDFPFKVILPYPNGRPHHVLLLKDWKQFEGGTEMEVYEDGQVARGVLSKDFHTDGGEMILGRGLIEIYPNRIIKSGTLAKDWISGAVVAKGGSIVRLYDNAVPMEVTLARDFQLPWSGAVFRAGTVFELYPNKKFKAGTLAYDWEESNGGLALKGGTRFEQDQDGSPTLFTLAKDWRAPNGALFEAGRQVFRTSARRYHSRPAK